MQWNGLQKPSPVGRSDPDVENVSLAVEGQRNVHACLAKRPDRAVEARHRSDWIARHCAYGIVGPQARAGPSDRQGRVGH